MSKEELERRALKQAEGMRNAWPDCEVGRMSALQNMSTNGLQWRDLAPLEAPPKLTLWQRFKAWRERTGFFMDGRDGGM